MRCTKVRPIALSVTTLSTLQSDNEITTVKGSSTPLEKFLHCTTEKPRTMFAGLM